MLTGKPTAAERNLLSREIEEGKGTGIFILPMRVSLSDRMHAECEFARGLETTRP
jgi:hypothetical protein